MLKKRWGGEAKPKTKITLYNIFALIATTTYHGCVLTEKKHWGALVSPIVTLVPVLEIRVPSGATATHF